MSKKKVPVQLDKKRNLKFGFNAMVAFEEVTGEKFFDVMGQVTTKKGLNMTMGQVRALLWACLLHEDDTLTPESLGDILDDNFDRFGEITEALGEAVTNFVGTEKTQAPKGKQAKN